jgi:hypothetical protein
MAAKVLIEGNSAAELAAAGRRFFSAQCGRCFRASTNRFLCDVGDVSCQGKVTSLPQASLLPMSVET